MKIVFLFLSMFFVSSAFADSLDYGKEAEVATHEAYQSYRKGDMKTLQFALERLTISCNMLALDGSNLPSSCVSWFAVLKEGCGTGIQNKALRTCARKFYQKRNNSPHASNPPPSLRYTLAKIFQATLSSFGQAHTRGVYQNSPHLSEKIHAEWAEFLRMYSYYKEHALAALSAGDRQRAQWFVSELIYYAKEKTRGKV